MLRKFIRASIKFIAVIVAIVILITLNIRIWHENIDQQTQIKALKKELHIEIDKNTRIALVNDNLKEKINSLKHGDTQAIEEEARKNFGMIGENETFYHFDGNSKPNQENATNTEKKTVGW